MSFHTPLQLNVYRVYSDPKGRDQRMVLALNSEEALAAVALRDPKNGKAYWKRKATKLDMSRSSTVKAHILKSK